MFHHFQGKKGLQTLRPTLKWRFAETIWWWSYKAVRWSEIYLKSLRFESIFCKFQLFRGADRFAVKTPPTSRSKFIDDSAVSFVFKLACSIIKKWPLFWHPKPTETRICTQLNRWSKKKHHFGILWTLISNQKPVAQTALGCSSSVCPRLPKILWEQWIVELPLQALHDSKLHRITDHQLSNHTTQPHSAIHVLAPCVAELYLLHQKNLSPPPIMELFAASWKNSRMQS